MPLIIAAVPVSGFGLELATAPLDHGIGRRAIESDMTREEVWQVASDNDIDAGRLWGCIQNGDFQTSVIQFLNTLTEEQKVRWAQNDFTDDELESLEASGFTREKVITALNAFKFVNQFLDSVPDEQKTKWAQNDFTPEELALLEFKRKTVVDLLNLNTADNGDWELFMNQFLDGLTVKQKVKWAKNDFTDDELATLKDWGFTQKNVAGEDYGDGDDDNRRRAVGKQAIKDALEKCLSNIKGTSLQDLLESLNTTADVIKGLKPGKLPPGKRFGDWVKNFKGLAGFPTDFKPGNIADPSKWTFDVADLELEFNTTGMRGLERAIGDTFQLIQPSPELENFTMAWLKDCYVEFLTPLGRAGDVLSIAEECFSLQSNALICKQVKNFNPFKKCLQPSEVHAILKKELSQEVLDRIQTKVPASSKGDKVLNFVKLFKRGGFDFKGLLNLLSQKTNFTYAVPELPSVEGEYDDDAPADSVDQGLPADRRREDPDAVGGFVETQYKAQATLATKEQETKKTEAITGQNEIAQNDLADVSGDGGGDGDPEAGHGVSLHAVPIITGTLAMIVALLA